MEERRSEDDEYRLARFYAHVSEGELVYHWKALLAEPRSKQKEASTLYLLTGQIHGYISHLSALAAHRGRIHSETALPLIEKIGKGLSSQLSSLQAELQAPWLSSNPPIDTQVSKQLSQLMPTLKGEDLLVTFQLLRFE